jgi:hypothetical protein
MEGNFLSEFHVGDVRPDPRDGEYCSAHVGWPSWASNNASDGVEINAESGGMEVYRALVQKPGKPKLVDHLNPQTMD